MSGLALGWVRKRRDWPSREVKDLMMYLADNANEQMAWPSKATLAEDAMCSEKTVMRLLAQAVACGLLIRLDVEDRATGRTRTCGYYFPIQGRAPSGAEIAGFERAVGGRVTQVSPWEGDTDVPLEGDTGVTGRGTTVSPLYEPPLQPESSDELSPGAREAVPAVSEELVQSVRAAMPVGMGKVSREPDYREALEVLAGQGEDLSVLPDRLRRLGRDKLFLGLKVPPRLERWLLDGQWRFYADQPELALSAAVADGEALPEAIISAVRPFADDGELVSYLTPAALRTAGGRTYVVARTGMGRDWIAKHWARISAAWTGAVPLQLIAKSEFEALLRQGSV